MDILSPNQPQIKPCSKCGKNPRPSYSRWCNPCLNAYRQERYDAGAKRDENLRKNYNGFSQADYDLMLFQQGGVCAICKQPETKILRGKVQPLEVDHNHETDQVRQLLCSRCNCIVRDIEKNRDLVKQALAYLKKHDT